ncbi:Uncharacterised protein [Streptococcus agalactiae]|nr:Uncharacterised protein [Streptococcus agalactiae]VEJ26772.1 Uncharacterised protein [Streptococcus agalactiae]
MSKKIKNFILLNIGSLIVAFGFNAFFLHNHIVTGGLVVWQLVFMKYLVGILLFLL